MGEYADMAIDAMLSEDEYALRNDGMDDYGEPLWSPFYTPPERRRSRKQRRRDRQRARKSMRECQFCGKYPLFFHEERPHKWILAEWNDENRPVRHVCKLKERFNNVRR